MIKGMTLTIEAFKNDKPFWVVVTKDTETVYEGGFEGLADLECLECPGYEVDDVFVDPETLTMRIPLVKEKPE